MTRRDAEAGEPSQHSTAAALPAVLQPPDALSAAVGGTRVDNRPGQVTPVTARHPLRHGHRRWRPSSRKTPFALALGASKKPNHTRRLSARFRRSRNSGRSGREDAAVAQRAGCPCFRNPCVRPQAFRPRPASSRPSRSGRYGLRITTCRSRSQVRRLVDVDRPATARGDNRRPEREAAAPLCGTRRHPPLRQQAIRRLR